MVWSRDAAADAPLDAAPDAAPTSGPLACRSALPFGPERHAPVDDPQPAPVTSALARSTCEALARRTHHRADAAYRALPEFTRGHDLDPVTRCYGAGDGAWAFEITAVDSVRPDPRRGRHGTEVRSRIRVTYVQADGATRAAPGAIEIASGDAEGTFTSRLSAVQTFDWDGDGRAELYFSQTNASHQGAPDPESARLDRWWTFTARGNDVAEFAPAAARATEILDADGDGRPDIVLRSPWLVVSPCAITLADYPGPRSLLHALPGGTFSSTDAAAMGFVAAQCRVRPTRLFPPESGTTAQEGGSVDPPFVLGCARWWGWSADALQAEIARHFSPSRADADAGEPEDETADCFPQDEMLRAAAVAPPEEFRLRCE